MEVYKTGKQTDEGRDILSWDKEGKSKKEAKRYEDGNYFGIYPGFIKRLALRCMFGKIKYGDPRGWRFPRPSSTYADSVSRHWNQYLEGDNREDHLAAAVWNIMAIMYNEAHARRKFHDIEERRGTNENYSYPTGKDTV